MLALVSLCVKDQFNLRLDAEELGDIIETFSKNFADARKKAEMAGLVVGREAEYQVHLERAQRNIDANIEWLAHNLVDFREYVQNLGNI